VKDMINCVLFEIEKVHLEKCSSPISWFQVNTVLVVVVVVVVVAAAAAS
jgi:hypothetical protein